MPQTNIIQAFWERAAHCPDKTAILHKVGDKFLNVTWQEQAQIVESVASALLSMGVKAADKVAIMSPSCSKWSQADLGILSCGAVAVPVYPSLNEHEMEYVLRHSEATGVFMDNVRQLKKLLSLAEIPPGLRFVVLFDKEPIVVPDNLLVLSFDALLARGRENEQKQRLAEIVREIKPEDLATIVYTSGTTGVPKGAMIRHSSIYFICQTLNEVIGFTEDDIALSFLPLSHIFERVGGQFLAIYAGIPFAYAESMEKVAENIAEVRPTMMNAVPRFFEKVYNRIQGQIRHLPLAQQYLARWAVSIGRRAVKARQGQEGDDITGRIYRTELRVADRLVFRKIRQRFGGRLRFIASGAAPLSTEVNQFFEIIGLPILEGYGLTETTAPVACNRPSDIRVGTVGKPLPGVEVRIAEDGEIMVKGPSLFSGYYKNQIATDQVLVDGWFLTGDIGELDQDGYLRIKDRKKDIIITAGGKHVAPQQIENMLAGQGAISRVLVYGDRRKFISALITLNPDELATLARTAGVSFTDTAELIHHPVTVAEVERLVGEINSRLASFEQIKRFIILNRDFTIEENELTPTLKLKRKLVTEKYMDLLDSLYDKEDIQLEKAQ